MNFQEGTVVTTQINHPPITLSGVVIASKKIDTEEERTFEVFKLQYLQLLCDQNSKTQTKNPHFHCTHGPRHFTMVAVAVAVGLSSFAFF